MHLVANFHENCSINVILSEAKNLLLNIGEWLSSKRNSNFWNKIFSLWA